MRTPPVLQSLGNHLDEWFEESTNPLKPRWEWWRGDSRAALTLRVVVPLSLTIILATWYFRVFTGLVWDRHEFFGTFDYDLGMYDQGIWKLAHGGGFMTSRGMHVFGHHANIGYLLLVPFYWIGIGGPHFLNIINNLGVVAVAWPLYLFGTRHMRSHWAGLAFVGAYFFHFAPQWKMYETFHAESLAAPFLVAAIYFLTTKQWTRYWIAIGLAIIWKEDVSIFVAMLALPVWWIAKDVRRALTTFAVGVLWFLLATKVVMVHFSPEGAVYDNLFCKLGETATEVATNAVTDPGPLVSTLDEHGVVDGTSALASPYGFAAIGSPAIALAGAPQMVVSYATCQNFTWDLRWHYLFMPYLSVLVASVWVAAGRKRVWCGWPVVILMVIGTGVSYRYYERFDPTTPVFAPSGEDVRYRAGVGPWALVGYGLWPATGPYNEQAIREAMAMIPDDAAVTAPYNLVPHLSHRDEIYTFPNPWRAQNWGIPGANTLPSPDRVEYLIMWTSLLNNADRALYDQIKASGEFEVVYNNADIELLHRTS
jgi:uncharacterized membrane protein